MYHPRLKGTYYEAGHHYASLLYKNGFRFPEVSQEKIDFGKNSLPYLLNFYPEVVEEIKGFADGCHVPYEQIASFILSIGIFEVSSQCSIFAMKQNGETIIGRNYDMLLSMKHLTESTLSCMDNKYRYVGHSDCFIGKVDGLNEKGLFIGITLVPNNDTRFGINFYFAVRYILEHCANVQEAIHVLQNFHTSMSNNYLLADKEGNMAVVEMGPNHFHVRYPEKDQHFIVCTNHFSDDKHIHATWSKTEERKESLTNHLKQEQNLTEEKAQQFMADSKGFVCLNMKQENFGTLFSVICNLNSLQILRAEGSPNRTKYKPDNRLIDTINKQKK